MHKVGNVLAGLVARQGSQSPLIEARLRLTFKQVVGDALADACDSIEVERGVVSVTTANPALAHQLRLDSIELMRRLNAESRLPQRVREIKVRVGRPPR
ncbi:MAG: DUF721 domain-containing protein [Candidatus Dormibacteraeota bacterium]|uniref:DUF721 domain-containing protein n=1 Tax=Candidatus Dormiibacter inghamiae TaxID=3127013 RepID=A0A934KHA6_9BACT|nr:DUF721 domain-containing protein [Candidatus Dormibacteraeota bacterium]MBJ7605706.1 DUF721 domain-containing protein [Candidatus Dormibacteraeota bacterium]